MGELGHFHQPKQRSKEQKLTRKRTVERCDGNTNIVVIKAKKTKIIPDMTKFEIDTFDYYRYKICRNGGTKNWRLLLLSIQVVRSQVHSQAPSVLDCWSNLI